MLFYTTKAAQLDPSTDPPPGYYAEEPEAVVDLGEEELSPEELATLRSIIRSQRTYQ